MVDFLDVQLALASTFAEMALDSFAAGQVYKARKTAAAAREAYGTVRKVLPKLTVQQREPIEAKLAMLDPLIEQLATIRQL
jgi:hypothetical protein